MALLGLGGRIEQFSLLPALAIAAVALMVGVLALAVSQRGERLATWIAVALAIAALANTLVAVASFIPCGSSCY